MDLVTLALAKKYTDEQVGSGGGGTAEIPFFALYDCGIDEIRTNGETIISDAREKDGVIEIRNAIGQGAVNLHIRFVDENNNNVWLNGVRNFEYDTNSENYELSGVVFIENEPYTYTIVVERERILAKAVKLELYKETVTMDLTAFGIPDISYLLEGTPIDFEVFSGAYMLAETGAVKLVYNSAGKKHSGTYPSFVVGKLEDLVNGVEIHACIQAPICDGTTVVNGYLMGTCKGTGGDGFESTLKYVTTA